jgi:VanZ family protein
MVKKNLLSILVALIIMYLSLASADTFDEVPVFDIPFLDKIVHFGMYFGLMSTLIFENRKNLKNNNLLYLIGLIPLFYGILMEFLQSIITRSRDGNIYDVFANLSGIIISILLWLAVKPYFKENIK